MTDDVDRDERSEGDLDEASLVEDLEVKDDAEAAAVTGGDAPTPPLKIDGIDGESQKTGSEKYNEIFK